MKRLLSYIQEHWKELILLVIGILAAYTLATYLIIERESTHMHSINSQEIAELSADIDVGIVFGGGVDDDGPRPVVQGRLDTAKELLDEGYVDKLILSGDNRFLDYNEPAVMFNYLVEAGVDENRLQADFAGRSTYETCERAKKIFGVTSAFLISESTHLPRAIYLCRHFGIESYGVKSENQTSRAFRLSQYFREVLARNKAIFNAYILGENTILGDPISL